MKWLWLLDQREREREREREVQWFLPWVPCIFLLWGRLVIACAHEGDQQTLSFWEKGDNSYQWILFWVKSKRLQTKFHLKALWKIAFNLYGLLMTIILVLYDHRNYKILEKQTYSPLCQKHTQSQTWRDVEPVHRGPHLLHGDKQELKKRQCK